MHRSRVATARTFHPNSGTPVMRTIGSFSSTDC